MNTFIKTGMPFNLEDLIHRRAVEGNRVEFKSTWNPPIKAAVIRTISAFANDLLNLNGGYIVLGIAETNGVPALPPQGLDNINMDQLQRDLRGSCRNLKPEYQPLVFPNTFQDRLILVIWVPGGDNRPYQAPDDINIKGSASSYYVRQGSETIRAQGEILRLLLEATAKVPFDDRRALEGTADDLSPTLVRRFLTDIRSDLVSSNEEPSELYRKLRIVRPINAHEAPRNVGLLFFSEDPEKFFGGGQGLQ